MHGAVQTTRREYRGRLPEISYRRFVRSALQEPHRPDFPHTQEQARQDHIEPGVVNRGHHQGTDAKRQCENLQQHITRQA